MTITEQMTFDIAPLVQPDSHGLTIQQRFELFHQANPWVYAALEHLADDMINRGHRRVGVRMLWEVVRWNYNRSTVDVDGTGFKVNDHFHSRYVRLLLDQHPEWADVFETRELRAS